MGMQLVFSILTLFVVAVFASSVFGSTEFAAWPTALSPEPQTVDPVKPAQQPSAQAADHEVHSSSGSTRHGGWDDVSPAKPFHVSSIADQPPTKASRRHNVVSPSSIAATPSSVIERPLDKQVHDHSYSPHSIHRNHVRNHATSPKASRVMSSPANRKIVHPISPFHAPSPSLWSSSSAAPALPPRVPRSDFNMPIHSPAVSPMASSLKKTKAPPPLHAFSLPPPPPNSDCASVACSEPFTYTPPGLPCRCVRPIQVELRLGITINKFFTLVTELADEIAASISLNNSQVRIMGANIDSQQLEESTVLVNLVPSNVKFSDATAFSIYKKFLNKQVFINASRFGAYDVLYVRYPGLPSSPSSLPSAYTDHGNNGRIEKPLGVDVPWRKRDGLSKTTISIIVVSSFVALIIIISITWLLLLKRGPCAPLTKPIPHSLSSSLGNPSGTAGKPIIFDTGCDSASKSFTDGTPAYTGSAKIFTLTDLEKATNKFDASRIAGEGGFGIVYSGQLDDGQRIAVKVLKREDHHGGREFLAEVEMLSRLHHRNLVKLIGICTEHHIRCLIYELIPNGSVESHLHGVDKESNPLDWGARMKIALGAARGLAYLHEDSSPHVIHRDFKSSNILLEHDFTPKVSDFGLARVAIDEGNQQISTHVMGTFGYLAPEYAMTGHLLVKSDVYSYGVVLLELLTGRKPVDLAQPPGQENLVTYARPLLTSKEGLETIVDPAIKYSVPFDIIIKVVAIVSMCVQPEASHRPFMGEVVQALKLVCNEFDEAEPQGSGSCTVENLLIDLHSDEERLPDGITEVPQACHQALSPTSDLLTMSTGVEGQEYGSFRKYLGSGPLQTGKRRHFWQRLSLSRGIMSEHGILLELRHKTDQS